MNTPREVADAAELLGLSELTEIRVYEVTGRRVQGEDGDEAREATEDLQLQARGGDDWFETRGKMLVQTAEADLVADAAAIFTFSEPVQVSHAVATEFVERVGVMAVYPFLREHIHTTASRLGVPAPVVGLLRAGGFHVDAPEAPPED